MSKQHEVGYEKYQRETLEGRELEAAVLLKAAQKLKRCREEWNQKGIDTEALGEALRFNQRLWTLFQVELSEANHPMPMELRVSLLRLCDYVDRKTFQLLTEPVQSLLDSLVQVNCNMAEGLLVKTRVRAPQPAIPHIPAEEIPVEVSSGIELDF